MTGVVVSGFVFVSGLKCQGIGMAISTKTNNFYNIIRIINRSEYIVGVNIVEMVLRDLSSQRLSHPSRSRQFCIKLCLSTSARNKLLEMFNVLKKSIPKKYQEL